MSHPVLTLTNVSVTYTSGLPLLRKKNSYQALKNISFTINNGDSIGIIGRNGAGKSTLLKLLSGVIKPDQGSIINHGYSTSLLTLNPGFDGQLSGRVNAEIGAMLLGISRKKAKESLEDIKAMSELGDFFEQAITTYSTGMRARLGFAIANTVKSDILLIDEILAVGDVQFKKKSKQIMQQKFLSGDTIVLVSHGANDIRELCNRAIWIEKGLIQMDGKPDDVIKAYEKNS